MRFCSYSFPERRLRDQIRRAGQPPAGWLPSVVAAHGLSQSERLAVGSVVPLVVGSFWAAVLTICAQPDYETTLLKDIDPK